MAGELDLAVIVNGLNTDDLSDHRPGNEAAEEAGVRSPFVELGLDKAAIRDHSRRLGLPTAEKPELACLASRFPTGTPISITGLEQVAAAEEVVAGLGFSQYRVRFHGDLARIEVPASEIERLDRCLAAGTASRGCEGGRISLRHRRPGGLLAGLIEPDRDGRASGWRETRALVRPARPSTPGRKRKMKYGACEAMCLFDRMTWSGIAESAR